MSGLLSFTRNKKTPLPQTIPSQFYTFIIFPHCTYLAKQFLINFLPSCWKLRLNAYSFAAGEFISFVLPRYTTTTLFQAPTELSVRPHNYKGIQSNTILDNTSLGAPVSSYGTFINYIFKVKTYFRAKQRRKYVARNYTNIVCFPFCLIFKICGFFFWNIINKKDFT